MVEPKEEVSALHQLLEQESVSALALTREEYLRLLHTAKMLEKEKVFFLIKTICCVGLKVGEIAQFTVDVVRKGRGVLVSKGTERVVVVPAIIQAELLSYAERNAVSAGPVFQNRFGKALDRVWIFNAIQDIAEKAGVPAEKCSPKSLRGVYLRTQKEIYDDLDYVAKQMYEQLLAAEQLTNTW